MSHVTVIKSVPIKDIRAIEAAVRSLQADGVRCELRQNQGPRLYSSEQTRAHKNCAYTLYLPDSAYDVGFEAIKDSDGRITHYEAVTDFYTGGVERALGFNDRKGNEDPNLIKMGKFYQRYSEYATMYAAQDQGYDVERQVDPYGNVQLIMTSSMF